MLNGSKDHARLKVHLKMSVTRLRNLQQKKTAVAKAQRRELAGLLANGKDQSARIRVENIIREDISVELLEILELYCELLTARIGLLETRECDPGLEEAVKSLIYSAHRSEVKELMTLRQMFTIKYGKKFESDALENVDDKVNAKVVAKLSIQPPPQDLVTRYLKEIARTYHVEWHSGDTDSDDSEDDTNNGPPSGGLAEREGELPNTPQKESAQVVNVALPSPSTENPRPRLHIPADRTVVGKKAAAGDGIPAPPSTVPKKQTSTTTNATNGAANGKTGTDELDDQSFDALMARFEKLKKG